LRLHASDAASSGGPGKANHAPLPPPSRYASLPSGADPVKRRRRAPEDSIE
jgi:hypothetical protein